jgi:hypothetical protein
MIIKLGHNPGFKRFASKNRVKAVKLREDSLVETSLGFLQGKKGEFLVEAAPNIRFLCAEKVFLAQFRPVKSDGEN